MPVAVLISGPALERPPRGTQRAAAGHPARALLPGLLLDADAAHVCRRWCQSGLDARPRGSNGRGADDALGQAAHTPAGNRPRRGCRAPGCLRPLPSIRIVRQDSPQVRAPSGAVGASSRHGCREYERSVLPMILRPSPLSDSLVPQRVASIDALTDPAVLTRFF